MTSRPIARVLEVVENRVRGRVVDILAPPRVRPAASQPQGDLGYQQSRELVARVDVTVLVTEVKVKELVAVDHGGGLSRRLPVLGEDPARMVRGVLGVRAAAR